ncbi:uncharacterized protein A4U43_C08F7290 [Asparagus officinalis]|uniref:NAC transcription factor NAM-B1-like n=1 Tax=Asparagus officinalis TaxID=4686 RepID=UPI00098E5F9C|nr:NAC transcription factor NAM-B1-like [Asparagus officinalis]ONK59522.1 uncharacterized protein A4U43_C08F7290 [Asparagus officinalis]
MDSSPSALSASSPLELTSPLPPYNEDGTHPCLPIGFRFCPTGDVVIRHFVRNKVLGAPLPINPIKEIDVYLFEPEELPITMSNGDEIWMYFFVYMAEENSDRSTPKGYWKLDVSDEPIKDSDTKEIIGLKNTFIYYRKELGPNGRYKTNWTMQEFQATNIENLKDPKMKNWVICKIETVIPQEYEVKVSKKGKMSNRVHKQ